LPNGRKIAYPFPKLKTNHCCDSAVVFMDNQKGQWGENRHGHGAYPGTWMENAVQAIARDLFIEAMQRLEAAGYGIVLHAHDEAVAEVPADFGSVADFLQIFTALPTWASGLPVAAKARVGDRWCKISKPEVTSEPEREDEPTPEGLTDDDGGDAKSVLEAAPGTLVRDSWEGDVQGPGRRTTTVRASLIDLIGEPLVDGKICCPFHDDSTPSLHVYDDHFHCYGCGAHGDAIDWLMIVEGLDRDAALLLLEHGPLNPTPRPACITIETPADHDAKRRRASQLWPPVAADRRDLG